MARKGRKRPAGEKGGGKLPPLSPERILCVMRQAGRPLYLREILHLSHLNVEERAEARAMVSDLVQQGRLVLIKGERYGMCDLMELVTGRLTVHPDGFGFVRPDSREGSDLFIPASGLKGAVHNDRVVARVERTRGKRLEGSVLRILERGIRRIVGMFHRGRSVSVVVPEDERLFFEVIIPRKHVARAKTGQVVVAEIDAYPSEGRNPEGRVVEILGDPDDLQVQTKIVLHKYELPHVFSPEVQEQASALPQSVRYEDCRGRKDLRDLPLVTIDGENAKDFDDAVFVSKTRTGYVLSVAIADVTHYVNEGSPIDKTAVERGTSVYFPGAVTPMLPEALSNDLCSLVPGEDRLAVVARISFDRAGKVRRTSFFKAIMRSRCRFTYKEVRAILADKDPELIKKHKDHVRYLRWMEELASVLYQRRRTRGSIDFDLPEPEVILGLTGNLEEIVRRERNVAHQIIEEFMIAANEAVAEFLTGNAVPTLYRVHGDPDPQKLRDFVEFARSLGIHIELPEDVGPWWCQEVLAKVAGRPQEYVVNAVLLRAMQQAVYSSHNTGHFGLASSTYLHFTSPIRRYPDVIVHRVLKANLNKIRKRPVYSKERLADFGTHCSTRERIAMEAEREVLERLKVRFMAEKIDEIYEGVISGVTSFGFFVELTDVFIEGAVRLVDLADDYYVLDQTRHRLVGRRTHRIFQIGQTLMVRVKGVNIARRHINFEVIAPQETERRATL